MSISKTLPPRTREEAIALGLDVYLPDEACRNGHSSERKVKNYRCVQCAREAASRDREKNPERQRDWYKKNAGTHSARQNEWRKRKTQTDDPIYMKMNSIRCRCRQNNIPFNLTNRYVQDLYEANPICPIFGVRMLLPTEEGPLDWRMSVDRIDPKGGYVMDNIALISYRANKLKNDETDPAIFRRLADWLEERQLNRCKL